MLTVFFSETRCKVYLSSFNIHYFIPLHTPSFCWDARSNQLMCWNYNNN